MTDKNVCPTKFMRYIRDQQRTYTLLDNTPCTGENPRKVFCSWRAVIWG
jgi:hypothetical protein